MAVYQEDREWSDLFIPRIKELVGPHLLSISSFEEDTEQAADLVVLRGRNQTVACRVRRYGYADNYGYQFTVRSARESGAQTELAKIVNGWGDLFFYGHSTADEKDIEPWLLIDFSAFRAHLIRNRGVVNKGQMSNRDGTAFTWFDVRSFPPDSPILVASSRLFGIGARNRRVYSPRFQRTTI